MKYRKFGKNGYDVSLFGVGCMRFTTKADGKIDRTVSTQIIRRAYQSGVNYFDTAYVYNDGDSESALGEAIIGLPREELKLVSKLPVFRINEKADAERMLEESLSRIGTDYLDVFLLHCLEKESWDKVKALGLLDEMIRFKNQGKIRAIGFSIHDSFDVFEEILNYYDWEMCQIQMNILDVDEQVTLRGLELAGRKGIPVVIMEPLRGGRLVKLPEEIDDLYKAYDKDRTQAHWAFKFMADRPEVAVILSGIFNLEQLEENLALFDTFEPGCMNEGEMAVVTQVREAVQKRVRVKCTGCEYCMPCPNGVGIPELFSMYNNEGLFADHRNAKAEYNGAVKAGKGPEKCVECGACQEHCPQHLSIIDELKNVKARFEAI